MEDPQKTPISSCLIQCHCAASGHVEVLANRVRELCAAFDELDADGLGDDAQESLWRAYDLMENACSALDEAGRDGEDGQ